MIVLSFMTRQFAVIAVFFAALTLVGCGDKEPEQRKAFIEYLQTRILDNKTLSVPKPNAEKMSTFGPYAAHYQIIVDFNDNMTKSSNIMQESSALQAKLQSMQGLQDNWKQVSDLLPQVDVVMKALDEEEKKAQTARAALKQPDDLKAVYDKAFSLTVTDQAQFIRRIVPSSGKTLKALADLGKFLDENRSKLKVSGLMVDSDDEALLSKVEALQDAYIKEAQQLYDAVKPVMDAAGKPMPF